ncbi:organic acid transporter SCDLUD_000710 [Saccharomycodes ludwigii]|uniref:organic acid transporter n=1 Tax=Saccharomycodes ludwigii TaxID=36035 RepID=UPI001E87A1A9|nr:hypothetical protein SCDLUD_000710 [Saccharomycodes ludwigii]KAH3903098.1 hypothetical protein SCDLUD_000710 [Saccharomycodes ludwigii]
MSDELASTQLIDEDEGASSLRVIKDLFAGTCGGVAQVLVGQPFDTTKVRLQTSTDPNINAIRVVKELIKNEGPLAFYKGTLTPLLGIGVCVSVQFGANEAMKRLFHKLNRDKINSHLTLWQYYCCGTVGGVSNAFIASPIEHVRIRLQIDKTGEFHGPLHVIKTLRKHKSLLRGLLPTMLRDGHGCGIYFLVYEALMTREMKIHNIERSQIASWKLCSFGGLSGCLLWCMVYPIDVVKSIIQTSDLRNKNIKMTTVFSNLYKEVGWKGLFKGFGPTIIRAAPANAATFATFEAAIRMMG